MCIRDRSNFPFSYILKLYNATWIIGTFGGPSNSWGGPALQAIRSYALCPRHGWKNFSHSLNMQYFCIYCIYCLCVHSTSYTRLTSLFRSVWKCTKMQHCHAKDPTFSGEGTLLLWCFLALRSSVPPKWNLGNAPMRINDSWKKWQNTR